MAESNAVKMDKPPRVIAIAVDASKKAEYAVNCK